MSFFERPILNSPYAYPGQHWELENGMPTNRIEPNRRRAELLSPIPKSKKQKAQKGSQAAIEFDDKTGIEHDRQGVATIHDIGRALIETKHQIRGKHRFYSQDLINHLFMHPYTKIDILKASLDVSRLTARSYLEALAADGILQKTKVGKSNFYINKRLFDILAGEDGGTP